MTPELKSLKNLHFNGLLFTKLYDVRAERSTEEASKFVKFLIFLMRSHGKFEGKMTCGLENDMRNLAHFYQIIRQSQNETLMASFCLKLKMYKLKNYRGVLHHGNEEWCKNWIGIDCQFKIHMRNLTNFDLST